MNTIKHRDVAIMRLRAETTQLRKALRINGRNGRRIQRAYDAALMLASWHIAYLPTSREFAMSQGMSQRQWENGTGLLKLARVVCGRRWQLHDLATIEQGVFCKNPLLTFGASS